jgi:hypothetical protein
VGGAIATERRWLRLSVHVTIGGSQGTGVVSVRKDCITGLDMAEERERVLEELANAAMIVAMENCKQSESYDVMDDDLEFGGWPPKE